MFLAQVLNLLEVSLAIVPNLFNHSKNVENIVDKKFINHGKKPSMNTKDLKEIDHTARKSEIIVKAS